MGSNHPTPVGSSNPPRRRARTIGPTAHDPLLEVDHAEHLRALARARPFRCPRCGGEHWVPAPVHRGLSSARCTRCLHVYDAEEATHG